MCNVVIFNYLDVVEFYTKLRLSFSDSCQVLKSVLPLNDGVMHVATQRPPYLFIYFFFFCKTFVTTTPAIKISYLFTTKLEKNWSR